VSNTFFKKVKSVVHRRKAARPPLHSCNNSAAGIKFEQLFGFSSAAPAAVPGDISSSGKFHTAAWARLLQPG